MRNRTLLIIGFVCLVIGLIPSSPVPIFLAVYLAHAGGALIVLSTLRFLFALALGWPVATVVTGAIGIAQYLVVAAFEPGTTPFLRRMFLSWSEMVAYCGAALIIIAVVDRLREWKQARDQAAWKARMREDDVQWRQ